MRLYQKLLELSDAVEGSPVALDAADSDNHNEGGADKGTLETKGKGEGDSHGGKRGNDYSQRLRRLQLLGNGAGFREQHNPVCLFFVRRGFFRSACTAFLRDRMVGQMGEGRGSFCWWRQLLRRGTCV